ncbi:TonB-dependent receptor domain-containing protein [Rhizobium alvei]|uniref:TonB-dependent receptor n=1 Tax=Rhizobium alvei TaxID=1132659 RepID=A0ABT8YHK2_9HYPH|nr:TonB-dependent receptor [Rhizobium alvei]MDO6963166.1 TonB-dependent receptor [Rhizobium alvei]
MHRGFVAVLLAGTAFLVSAQSGWAQPVDEDEIVLDDPGASDTADDAAASDGTTKLKRIVVGADGTAGAIADKPAAVSVTDAEAINERFAGDLNQVMRSTPGTFTREGAEQPGVVVNVRGMQGMGRINTMIDGVPQTFRNLSGHGGSFDNMVYIDPNLLAGVDVSRGAVSGSEGLGTLSGAANFRTLEIDDVLLPGTSYGALQTIKLGTNGYDFSRLTAAGWKNPIGDEGQISIVGAISGSNFSNFKNGDGIWYPYDASQDPRSGLFKLGIAPDSDHSLTLGGVFYDNAFAVESAGYDWFIKNQTYTAKYRYTPGNDLIDLSVNAYLNRTDIAMVGQSDGVFNGRDGTNTGLGFDINNVSLVDLSAETELKLTYGAAINSDDYMGNDQRGANPDGRLIKSGAFAEGTLTHGMFGLTTGLRYDAWNLSGITEWIEPGTGDCPAGGSMCAGESLERSGGKWSPKIGATFTPAEWVQLYSSYSYSMRPPTASEMFYPGGHNFTGTGDPIYNNPNLVPERMQGLDLGVNFKGEDLLTSGDKGFVKLGYFRNRISNFISYATDLSDGETRWVNLPGVTVMQGVEIEGSYDAGFAFGRVSFTVADTDQPLGAGAGFGNDVGTLPDDFATLEGGMRFFEQKLTLGGRIRYTGTSMQAYLNEDLTIERGAYTLFDLYGSYDITKNFKLFFTVENISNKSYWSANAGTSDIFSGVTNGRGRTIMLGATARF